MQERFLIRVEGAGTAVVASGERVLVALERAQGLGHLKGLTHRLPVGCRRGGCGICRVRILSGQYRRDLMSREHISLEDETEGRVLACAIYAESDLSLRLDPTPAWQIRLAAAQKLTGQFSGGTVTTTINMEE